MNDEMKVKIRRVSDVDDGVSGAERAATILLETVSKETGNPGDAIYATHMALMNLIVQNASSWASLKKLEMKMRSIQRTTIPAMWDALQAIGGRPGQDGRRPHMPATVDEVRERHSGALIEGDSMDQLMVSTVLNDRAESYAHDALDELMDNLDPLEQNAAASCIVVNVVALTAPSLDAAIANLASMYEAARTELIKSWPQVEADRQKAPSSAD